MANKRMFNIKIVDSDAFLDMPLSTQCLYFHLNMRADDDGFIGNPKRIQRLIGASEDDLKLLIAKRFVLIFEDGVIVIKHWRMHNTIRKDRYTQTVYLDELKSLGIKENNSYILSCEIENDNHLVTKWQPNVIPLGNPDIDIGLDIDKDIDIESKNATVTQKETKHKYGEYKNVLLTDTELEKLKQEYSNYEELIKHLDEYIEMKGYKAKSHYLAIKKWVVDAVNERKNKTTSKIQNNNYSFDIEEYEKMLRQTPKFD